MSDNHESSFESHEEEFEVPEDFSLPDASILIEKAKIKKKERLKKEKEERRKRLQDPVAYFKYLQGETGHELRIPQAYGYARVSTDAQFKYGDSVSAQMEAVKNYYLGNLVNSGVGWGGIECDDFGVSASKNMFIDRPAGKRLIRKMRRGDHIIIDKVDRIIRKMKDIVFLMEVLNRAGIRIHFVMHSFDPNTPNGKLVLHMMAAVAENESHENSIRVTSRNRWAAANGYAIGRVPVYGTMHVKHRGHKHKLRLWNKQERALMNEIVRLRDKHKLGFAAISQKYREEIWLIRRQMKKVQLKTNKAIAYTCSRLYCLEKFYQDHAILDPRQIPPHVHDLAIKYCISQGYIRRGVLHQYSMDGHVDESGYNKEWDEIRRSVLASLEQENGQENDQEK